ncbi:hypothetical protein C2E23DRAFT_801031 [Lenzites betulinus]|nr:hypothetical protein C2E23DRAFT_801031 [Lenzites betulinus]
MERDALPLALLLLQSLESSTDVLDTHSQSLAAGRGGRRHAGPRSVPDSPERDRAVDDHVSVHHGHHGAGRRAQGRRHAGTGQAEAGTWTTHHGRPGAGAWRGSWRTMTTTRATPTKVDTGAH